MEESIEYKKEKTNNNQNNDTAAAAKRILEHYIFAFDNLWAIWFDISRTIDRSKPQTHINIYRWLADSQFHAAINLQSKMFVSVRVCVYACVQFK